jgi:hypothetical protein
MEGRNLKNVYENGVMITQINMNEMIFDKLIVENFYCYVEKTYFRIHCYVSNLKKWREQRDETKYLIKQIENLLIESEPYKEN